MSRTPASLLFVVPRFHTNLFFAVEILRAAGHRVSIFAGSVSPTEDHRSVTPHVFGKTPQFQHVSDAMAEVEPDLVLIRNAVALSRHAAVAARRQGRNARLYNQQPLTQATTLRRRIDLWLRRLPLHRVTPVRGIDLNAPTDPFATYLPWPVERLDPTRRSDPRPEGPLRLLCVGRLTARRKHQVALIDEILAAGLQNRVHLTLAGLLPPNPSGDAAAYHAELEARTAGAPWITVHANLPFPEMPRLYAEAQVCLLPSTYETLGIAPIEGMAYGCVPVISTASGAAGLIAPGQNGLHCDIERPGDIAAQIIRLLDEPELLPHLSSGALETVSGELGPTRFLDRIDALLAQGPR